MRARLMLAALAALAALGWSPVASQQSVPVVPAPPVTTEPVPVPDPAAAPPAAPQLTATDLTAWLDGFVPNALEAGKIAGAQVVVVKDGAVLVKKGYGVADVARRRPMDPDRILMRIGSTSKLLTWIAVLQQVEAGRIDLNADVNRYLDFRIQPRANSRPITMNDLMTHRGGFEEGLKDVLATDPARLKSTERYLKENGRPLLFPAGKVPAYSNYGVALAGYIVQRVSGEPFESYVERHIFAPLGMRRSTFRQPLAASWARDMSLGYRTSDAPSQPFELIETAPAGSASATGADMARFMIALLNDGARLLRPETARLTRTPQIAAPPGFDTMAHGFFNEQRNGRTVIGHGGDTIVFHTDLSVLPDDGVGVFVSFNSRGENDAVYDTRERLLAMFLGRYFPAPKTTTPPAIASARADAAALAGRYESSRRVEHGFISLFYLLQQDQVNAAEDGTIRLASIPDLNFREIAPGIWQQVDGPRQLRVSEQDRRRTIMDSRNPVGILQAVPLARNALLFQLVLGFALLTLLAVVIAWPVGAWLRRRYKAAAPASTRLARARLFARIAAVADLAYLAAWYVVVAPVLALQLDGYNDDFDGVVRALQVAMIIPIAGAGAGLWLVAVGVRERTGWGDLVRAALLCAALIAVVWVAWMGGFFDWRLNY